MSNYSAAYHVVNGLEPSKNYEKGTLYMSKTNFKDFENDSANQRITLAEEYNLGNTKVRICNNSNSYINLSETQKKDRDYSIGGAVLRLFNEIKNERKSESV